MKIYFVAVDIGCLECGQASNVLGIFTNKIRAEEVCKNHKIRQKVKWHGDHLFEVFNVKDIDFINYVKYK